MLLNQFSFRIIHEDKKSGARTGVIRTPHGDIETPAFVPVGTQATVKSLTPDELRLLDVQFFFVNTYHMYLRPGNSVIKKFGGLHSFMGWQGPIITDSGGFQVFSLAQNTFKGATFKGGIKQDQIEGSGQLVTITENGVQFRSHWDGSKHLFTAEKSMRWQWELGSDIHIAFDDCTPYPVTYEQAKISMERTHRWAKESLDAHRSLAAKHRPYQALYGSIQGSVFEDLRKTSARTISAMDFDGVAIGGVSVGESKKEMQRVLGWVVPLLPDEKPRHLLGVGEIDDIFALVAAGVDTFDCVQPTRLARMGRLLVRMKQIKKFEIDITKKTYAEDIKPIDPTCGCYTCRHFSRGYVHHLFRVRELLAYRLATMHNIHFVNTLVGEIREAISNDRFLDLSRQWL